MNIESLMNVLVVALFGLFYYFLQKKIDNQTTILIENHKSTLQLLSYKENKLHDKRSEVIAELYGKLVGLQFEINGLTNWALRFITVPSEEEDAIAKENSEMCIKLYNDFYLFYLKHKLYFPEKTCESIDEIQIQFRYSINKFSHSLLFKEDSDYSFILTKEASDNMATKIPSILKIIENDFRNIIGSDIELLKN